MAEDLTVRDEAQMITSILSGDVEQYHALIRPYEQTVYRVALSYMKNEADAEDVAQEAFLKGFRKLRDFRGTARFSTWLISITLNESRGRLRHYKIVPVESLDEGIGNAGRVSPALLQDWREVPSQLLERKEVRQLILTAIEGLSPIYRDVVLLRDIEELSMEEAASVLQISIPSIKVRLHRARMMLQKVLAPQLKHVNPRKSRWLPWL